MAFMQYVWLTCDTGCGAKFDSLTDRNGMSRTRSPRDNRYDAAQIGWTHSRKFGDRCPMCSKTVTAVRQWNEYKTKQAVQQ